MVQSNWWQLLPRVQSAPLVRVGDHNHGLVIYIFGNLCTSISQCDSAIWDDDNVGSTSPIISFHQDVPLLGDSIKYHWFRQRNFPIGLSGIFLISLSGRRFFDSQSIRLSETVFFHENPRLVPMHVSTYDVLLNFRSAEMAGNLIIAQNSNPGICDWLTQWLFTRITSSSSRWTTIH